MNSLIKILTFVLFILFQGACSTQYLKMNQVLDKEQFFAFKAKSKLYSNINESYNHILFVEYSHYQSIAKKEVKKKCLDHIKINKLKNAECKFFGTEFTDRILVAID